MKVSQTGLLVSIQIAKPALLLAGKRQVRSAIRKQAVPHAKVHALGLEGDEQADLRVHGGPSKAVYAYPQEHYDWWRANGNRPHLPPGSLGENLSLQGLLEQDVYVGDALHFPDCVLVVTQPREPCFKFNIAMQDSRAAKKMAQTGYCGFYLSVLKPGSLAAGQSFVLHPGTRQACIAELFRLAMRQV